MSYNPELSAQGQFDYQNASGEVSETGTPGKFRSLDVDGSAAVEKFDQLVDQDDDVLATENQNGSGEVSDNGKVDAPEFEEPDGLGEKPQTNGDIEQGGLEVDVEHLGKVQVQLEATSPTDEEATSSSPTDVEAAEGKDAETLTEEQRPGEALKVGDDVITQEGEGPDQSVGEIEIPKDAEKNEIDVAVGPDTEPTVENGQQEDEASSKKAKRRSFLESLHFPKFDFPPGRKHHNIGTQTPTTEKQREKEMKKGKVLKEKKPKKSKEKHKDKKGAKGKGKEKKTEPEEKPEKEDEIKADDGGQVDVDVKVAIVEKDSKESDVSKGEDTSKDDDEIKDEDVPKEGEREEEEVEEGEEEEDKAPDLEWDLEKEIRMVEEEFSKIAELHGDGEEEKPQEEDKPKQNEETSEETPTETQEQEPQELAEKTEDQEKEAPQVVEVSAEVQPQPAKPVKAKPAKPRKTVIETGLVLQQVAMPTEQPPTEIKTVEAPKMPEENIETPVTPDDTPEEADVQVKQEETVETQATPEEPVEIPVSPETEEKPVVVLEEPVTPEPEEPATQEEPVEKPSTPELEEKPVVVPEEPITLEAEEPVMPAEPEDKPTTPELEEKPVVVPEEPVTPAELQDKPSTPESEEKPAEPEKETKVSFDAEIKPVKIKPKPKRPRSVVETGLVVVPVDVASTAEAAQPPKDQAASVSSLSSSDHDASKEVTEPSDEKHKKPEKKKKTKEVKEKKKEKKEKKKPEKDKHAKVKEEKEKANEEKEEKKEEPEKIESLKTEKETVHVETVTVVEVQRVESAPEQAEKRKKEEKEPKEKPKKKKDGQKKEKAKKRKEDGTEEDEDHGKRRKEETDGKAAKKKKERSPWKLRHKGKARTKSDSSGENIDIAVTSPTSDSHEEIETTKSDADTTRSEGDVSDTRLMSVSTLSSEGDRTPTDGGSLRPLSQTSEPEGGDTSPPVSPSSTDSPFEDVTKKDVIEIRPISPISTTSDDSTLRPSGEIITEEELKKPAPKDKGFKFRTFPRSSTPKKPKRKDRGSQRRSLDAEDVDSYIVEGSMPVHLPEPASKNYRVVVAIDFGTTFSGYAYSFTNDSEIIHIMRKWEGGDPGVSNMKTPTTLLLTSDGHFHSFGFTARDFYHDLNYSDSKKWLYFDKFKMTLHSSQDLDSKTELTAVNGKKLPAIDIFAHALKFFKEHALQELNDQLEDKIKNENIRWVITVPAIWRQPAKQFMREAAYKAGISSKDHPEKLLIALEPEAASIYIRKMRLHEIIPDTDDNNRFTRYRAGCRLSTGPLNLDFMHGTKYMVVDCGGGTVDITVHELEEHLGTLKELHKAAGGEYGSVSVDHAFEQLLIDIFTADFIDEFKMKRPAGWVDLMIAFEARKRNASPWKSNPLNVSLPFSFIDYYKKYTKNGSVEQAVKKHGDKDIRWSAQGMLRFTPEAMRALFIPTLHHICGEIEVVLQKPGLDHINYLFLVGGFAESPLLQDEVRKAFNDNLRVIIPQDVGLTILKGAVLYGLDPNVVRVRRSPLTYGVGVLNKFVQGKHPENKLIEKDGVSWCTDIFDEFVIADQPIAVGETVTRSYTPAKPNQKSTVINIYCTDRQRAAYITDEGVKKCGTLHIDMSDSTYMQIPRRREIQISMQFGDTEIKVSALDVVTGKCVKAGVDFLRK